VYIRNEMLFLDVADLCLVAGEDGVRERGD
jgi:hypothetical protein